MRPMIECAESTTGRRLTNAAGRLFAKKGVRATTVREICQKARANVAAINYHFGSKSDLYREVLDRLFGHALSRHPIDAGQSDARTVRGRLHAFVRGFLLRVLDPERPAWHHQLLAREMLDPSPEGRAAVERHTRQAREILGDIITEVIGPADEREIERCRCSIAGQCLHYHGQGLRAQISPGLTDRAESIEALADHITEFSMAGLRAVRNRLKREAHR
jgi:AcrR family transcriptional regulator